MNDVNISRMGEELEKKNIFNAERAKWEINDNFLMNKIKNNMEVNLNNMNEEVNEVKEEIEKCVYCGSTKIYKYGGKGQAMCEKCANGAVSGAVVKQYIRETPKIGRNEKCPCGSNIKYKKCCGK